MNRLVNQRKPISAVRPVRSGASVVEFAVILPLFLLVLGGMIEFGQAFVAKHALCNAARRGARQASMTGATNTQVSDTVKSHCTNALGVAAGDVTVAIKVKFASGGESTSLTNAQKGDACEVTVSVPFSKIGVSFFLKALDSTTILSQCGMEHE